MARFLLERVIEILNLVVKVVHLKKLESPGSLPNGQEFAKFCQGMFDQ